MSALASLHTAIVSCVDAVSGLTSAPVPFSARFIPAHGASAWFVVRHRQDAYGSAAGGSADDVLSADVELLWALTQDPNTAIGLALDKAEAIRSALLAAPLGNDGARIVVGGIVTTYTDDGAYAILTIPLTARLWRAA